MSPNVKKFISYDQSTLLFKNALLYDGTGSDPKPNQDVLIKGGTITEVGTVDESGLGAQVQVIDMTGKTLTPGFIMLHEHMFYPTLPDDFTMLHR